MRFLLLLLLVLLALALPAPALGKGPVPPQVPQLVDGAWILPPRPVDTGMGPEAGFAASAYEAAIYDACAYYGCDPEWVIGIMYCESGGDHSTVGPNGERGVMQFHPEGEWPYAAWLGPYEQIWLAAELLSSGYAGSWVCA